MEIQQIQALLEKYTTDQLSEKELEELSNGLSQLSEKEQEELFKMYAPLWEQAKAGTLPATTAEPNWQQLLDVAVSSDYTTTSRVIPFYKRAWLRYAAVFVLIPAGGYLWLTSKPVTKQKQPAPLSYQQPVQIKPGSNKATLTLSNGNSITLDSAINGSLVMQGSTQVMKLQDGSIIYKNGTGENSETLYNTISIPKGGQYQLTLADGTKVWLNASSSLHYPVAFNKKNRTVNLEGEAYFEVAKDRSRPFQVYYKNMKVEVLGTHFNIMAYDDEQATKTTLLEGSVKISATGSQPAIGNRQSAILKPGEQAVATANASLTIHHSPDVEEAIAWKNGFFHFDKADMPTVLRQVARWFDLEIVYKGPVSQDLFSGKIERNLPLQSILNLFRQSNLKFELKGRTLIIL